MTFNYHYADASTFKGSLARLEECKARAIVDIIPTKSHYVVINCTTEREFISAFNYIYDGNEIN